MLYATVAIAQEDFEDDTDDNTVPGAPIDDWVIPVLILGVIIMFFYFKSRKRNML